MNERAGKQPASEGPPLNAPTGPKSARSTRPRHQGPPQEPDTGSEGKKPVKEDPLAADTERGANKKTAPSKSQRRRYNAALKRAGLRALGGQSRQPVSLTQAGIEQESLALEGLSLAETEGPLESHDQGEIDSLLASTGDPNASLGTYLGQSFEDEEPAPVSGGSDRICARARFR